MNRRNFLATTLAGSIAVIAEKLFGFTKFLNPQKDMPITTTIDRKDLESGIGGFDLRNGKGTLLSRKTFTPIHINNGDNVEFTYTIAIR